MSSAAKPEGDAKVRPIDEHEYKDLTDSLSKGFTRDVDKLKRIRTAASNFTFTCAQVAQVAKLTVAFYESSVMELYPVISDKENFEVVLSVFKWKEEKEHVLSKSGWKKPE